MPERRLFKAELFCLPSSHPLSRFEIHSVPNSLPLYDFSSFQMNAFRDPAQVPFPSAVWRGTRPRRLPLTSPNHPSHPQSTQIRDYFERHIVSNANPGPSAASQHDQVQLEVVSKVAKLRC
jgi:hypothetical protein